MSLVAMQRASRTPSLQNKTPLKGLPFTCELQETTFAHPKSSLLGAVVGTEVTGAALGMPVGGAVVGASVGIRVGGSVVGAGVVGGVEGRNVSGHSPHSPMGMRPATALLAAQILSKAVPGISTQNSIPGPDPVSHSMTGFTPQISFKLVGLEDGALVVGGGDGARVGGGVAIRSTGQRPQKLPSLFMRLLSMSSRGTHVVRLRPSASRLQKKMRLGPSSHAI